jgi:D-ribulokinase
MTQPLVIGIDIGTSGVRAVAMDASFAIAAHAGERMDDHGFDWRDPNVWRRATRKALGDLLRQVGPGRIRALSVDGTSGTMLPVGGDGRPLAPALMYSDPVQDKVILSAIAERAPVESAAHGATSGLAKARFFQGAAGVFRIIHQADWIAGQFSGRFDVSDENNALKTGYDPIIRKWPGWIDGTGMRTELLPEVVAPGSPVGTITKGAAELFGLPGDTLVVAGTTDGCASFLATGAAETGDGVTVLGSSLTIKLLSGKPVFAPRYGIYSHRIGDVWLAGGASNTGGKVLVQHFPVERIVELSPSIDAETSTGLDYYPLPAKGERFPFADPQMQPRLSPRPKDDATFLKAMFEGIAGIEELAYRRLGELGGPMLKSVRSVGAGAKNAAWTAIRQRQLGVPFLAALSEEAAAGTARLALIGARKAGVI